MSGDEHNINSRCGDGISGLSGTIDCDLSLDAHTMSPEIYNVDYESDDDGDKLFVSFYNSVSLDQWQELLNHSTQSYVILTCTIR